MSSETMSIQEHGVQGPFSVLSPHEVRLHRDRLFDYVNKARSSGQGSATLEVTPFDTPNHPFAQAVMPLVQHPAVIGVLKELLGEVILLRGVNVFSKPPTGGKGDVAEDPFDKGSLYPIHWHWDDPFPPNGESNSLTAWIALTPSTPESGCVRYVLGSHRVPVARVDPMDRGALTLREDEWPFTEEHPIYNGLLEPGEMLVHHSATVHGSGPNYSNQSRVGIALRVFAPEAPHVVTGSRIGMLLGETPLGHDEILRKAGVQAKPSISITWWDGQRQNAESMNQSNRYDRRRAHKMLGNLLEEGVAAGDGESMFLLGRMRLVGMGEYDSDLSEAMKLFEQSSQSKWLPAQNLMEECKRGETSQVLQPIREQSRGLSLMAWCASVGFAKGIRCLLSQGAPVHQRFLDGQQALHVAVQQRSMECISALLDGGADPLSPDDGGVTPLALSEEIDYGGAVEVFKGVLAGE